MMKDKFYQWMVSHQLAETTAYTYQVAINAISAHYSEHKAQIDIYDITDAERLEPIRSLYQSDGEFGEFGQGSHGQRRAAINKYYAFLESGDALLGPIRNTAPGNGAAESSQNFAYERDLQTSLCNQISALFPNYPRMTREHAIKNRRIDVLLENPDNNSSLVIELKAGRADRAVFAQLSEYMGLLKEQQPGRTIRGVIIAGEISEELRLAVLGAGAADKIALQTYKMQLELTEVDIDKTQTE